MSNLVHIRVLEYIHFLNWHAGFAREPRVPDHESSVEHAPNQTLITGLCSESPAYTRAGGTLSTEEKLSALGKEEEQKPDGLLVRDQLWQKFQGHKEAPWVPLPTSPCPALPGSQLGSELQACAQPWPPGGTEGPQSRRIELLMTWRKSGPERARMPLVWYTNLGLIPQYSTGFPGPHQKRSPE